MLALWSYNRNRVKGIGCWTLNIWLQQAGIFFAAAVGFIPDNAAQLLVSVLTLTGSVIFYIGLAEFTETAVNRRLYAVILATVLLLTAVFIYVIPNPNFRTILFSLFCIFMAERYLSLFFRKIHFSIWYRKIFLVLIILYILFAVNYIVRSAYLLTFPLQNETILEMTAPILPATLLMSFIILMGVNYSIIILISNKLTHDLAYQAEEKERLLSNMKSLAETDSLTGLYNRLTIERFLQESIDSGTYDDGDFTVIMLDVDEFKVINDTWGHDVGDRVLIELAEILSGTDENYLIGRWGGDEFLIIKFHQKSDRRPQETADSIIRAVSRHAWRKSGGTGGAEGDAETGDEAETGDAVNADGKELHQAGSPARVTVSGGFTLYREGDMVLSMLKRADTQLYRAKGAGRNCAYGE